MVTLLDERQRKTRLLQHVPLLLGVILLAVASSLASMTWALVVIAVGLALIAVAALTHQRWEVTHKGHRIRFENNPFRGEKLFLDGHQVGRGKLGIHSEMRATIATGEAAGDTIVSQSEAGFTRFRCRIFIEPAAATGANLTNEQLLAEIERRGLHG